MTKHPLACSQDAGSGAQFPASGQAQWNAGDPSKIRPDLNAARQAEQSQQQAAVSGQHPRNSDPAVWRVRREAEEYRQHGNIAFAKSDFAGAAKAYTVVSYNVKKCLECP